MTARTRQGTGTAPPAVANGSDVSSERPTQFSWEDWFRHASSPQRADALGLAKQQGLLYSHQLPATTNGVRPLSGAAKEMDSSPLFKSLLAGKTDTLCRM